MALSNLVRGVLCVVAGRDRVVFGAVPTGVFRRGLWIVRFNGDCASVRSMQVVHSFADARVDLSDAFDVVDKGARRYRVAFDRFTVCDARYVSLA